MKKHLLWGAAAALVLSLSSCDGELIQQMTQEGLLGSAEITISGQNGYFSNDTTLYFASTICDKLDTNVTIDNRDTVYSATLDLFANVDLNKNELTFPFMGFQVSNIETGTYEMSHVLTPERLRDFNFDSIADLVFAPSGFNVMMIAVSDTSWYVADGGTITITEYPTTGHNMKGTFNNVQCYYFTQSDVEAIDEHLDDPDFNLSNYFHKTAVINGDFKSRVYPSLVQKIIDEAYHQRGLWEQEHGEGEGEGEGEGGEE